jgi:hypothetical protein
MFFGIGFGEELWGYCITHAATPDSRPATPNHTKTGLFLALFLTTYWQF